MRLDLIRNLSDSLRYFGLHTRVQLTEQGGERVQTDKDDKDNERRGSKEREFNRHIFVHYTVLTFEEIYGKLKSGEIKARRVE